MNLSISISEKDSDRSINGFCRAIGYKDTIGGKPNSESKEEAMRRAINTWIKSMIVNGEANAAAEIAKVDARLLQVDVQTVATEK